MRSLRISIILFSLLAACIAVNAVYINKCADTLSDMAARASDAEAIEELEEFWSKNKEFIGLSISETHLNSISQLIVSIRCDHESENRQNLAKDLALLSDAAEDIRRHERLSFENIF